MTKHTWKLIADESDMEQGGDERKTYRMRLRSGSLYRFELNTAISDNARQVAIAMTFVPDQEREELAKRGSSQRRRDRER